MTLGNDGLVSAAMGDSVKYFRELEGISQTDLGNGIGWSQTTVSHLESGTRPTTLGEFEQILRHLRVPLAEIAIRVRSVARGEARVDAGVRSRWAYDDVHNEARTLANSGQLRAALRRVEFLEGLANQPDQMAETLNLKTSVLKDLARIYPRHEIDFLAVASEAADAAWRALGKDSGVDSVRHQHLRWRLTANRADLYRLQGKTLDCRALIGSIPSDDRVHPVTKLYLGILAGDLLADERKYIEAAAAYLRAARAHRVFSLRMGRGDMRNVGDYARIKAWSVLAKTGTRQRAAAAVAKRLALRYGPARASTLPRDEENYILSLWLSATATNDVRPLLTAEKIAKSLKNEKYLEETKIMKLAKFGGKVVAALLAVLTLLQLVVPRAEVAPADDRAVCMREGGGKGDNG